jgi:DNA-binding NarL/FixJ family response regulator
MSASDTKGGFGRRGKRPRPPLPVSSAQTTCLRPASRVDLPHMKVSVAIVEDDSATREIIAGWIDQTSKFCCVGKYKNVTSALTALPAQSPDVVLVDINLPDFSGVECVRRLKPQMPNTQFVMVTVYGDSNHVFAALMAGACGYLLKRLTRANLLSALEEVHCGGSPMSGSIARKVVRFFQAPSSPAGNQPPLSPRELEVLQLVAEGYVNKEIADRLALSAPTVATYIRRIYEKLHVHSREAAIGKFSLLTIGKDDGFAMETKPPVRLGFGAEP